MVLQNVSKHLSCKHAVLISQNFSENGYFSVKNVHDKAKAGPS